MSLDPAKLTISIVTKGQLDLFFREMPSQRPGFPSPPEGHQLVTDSGDRKPAHCLDLSP